MRTTFCPECKKNTRTISDFGGKDSWLYVCSECDTELNHNFKLCLLAAGKGTRNNDIKGLHKALLPLENKPVISHIIENFDKNIEIVIAVGYKSEQIKSYLDKVHSDRKITYVNIENYEGPGSGPGYSLLMCEKELQCSFIFTSIDTILADTQEKDIFNFIGENWIGVADVDLQESLNYCLVKGKNYLEELYFGKGTIAFTGAAGISDYKEFFHSLKKKKRKESQYDDLHEYQVTQGFNNLKTVKLVNFTWYDTGNSRSYSKTKKIYSNDIVANKNDEAIFIDNNKVVKYFDSSDKVKTRVERTKYLNNNIPNIVQLNNNMYSYDYIKGELLSNIYDDEVLKEILSFWKKNFFEKRFDKSDQFVNNCKNIYKEKTYNRIKLFQNTPLDKIEYINGIKVKGIKELLDSIDWNSIYTNAIPTRFHGDFQPENIIYDGEDFKLIDWRESFGDSLEVGDLYYDLGKLYHALVINGQIILKKGYSYSTNNNKAYIKYNTKSNLLILLTYFKSFCKNNNLNWDNVELLGILQYIGICSLYQEFHKGEYGEFLFLLGKYLLTKKLNNERIN